MLNAWYKQYLKGMLLANFSRCTNILFLLYRLFHNLQTDYYCFYGRFLPS